MIVTLQDIAIILGVRIDGYRNEINILRQSQVLWTPYTADLLGILSPLCTARSALYLAQVLLIAWVVVEWHMSERVMRQFGYQQHFLLEVPDPNFRRINGQGQASTDWFAEHSLYRRLWRGCSDFVQQPQLVSEDDADALRMYMNWYKSWARLSLIFAEVEPPTSYFSLAPVHNVF
ncbi:Serine/threonine-protein phosphatase 7 long form like [Apostasia shenzhenica]|uniref:Serine/threonine-protein phosphatase 7 long form like n=1 Tax=Apostasia shenzhenica TaxID=1088818 RepID=A0A2I0ACG3_9ASPA|nr:Serine/threonine-protein phosphatase 7 long form like [Apostasia shenzhenica]